MLRIMIVDDEPVILRGIRTILSRRPAEYTVVGEAASVGEAVGAAAKCSPDVIMADIRMADGTGLEMIRQLKDSLPDTKYIILSGYGEFEYAQEALRLGVSDYILKPVDSRRIYAVLENMQELFQKKRQDSSKKQEEQERNSLYELLYRGNSAALCDVRRSVKEKCFCTILLLQLPPDDKEEGRKKAEQITREYLRSHYAGIVVPDGMELCVLLETEKISDVPFALEFLTDQIEEAGLCGIRYFTGGTAAGAEELQKLFYRAGQCRELAFYEPEGLKIQSWNGREAVPFTIDLLRNEVVSELCTLLKQKDTEGIRERLDGEMNWCREQKILPQDTVRYFQGLFRLVTAQMIREEFLPPVIDEVLSERIAHMNNCGSSRELLGGMESIMVELMQSDARADSGGPSRVIAEVKHYIQEHYAENISLNTLADHVFLSSKYLSDLFRRETGETVTRYLLYVRIEHAKQDLTHLEWKIYEIAERVGYPDTKHFIKAFRKETGMSPGEYRKRRETGK